LDLVDVVVQIKRGPKGYRRVTDVYLPKTDSYILKDGERITAELTEVAG